MEVPPNSLKAASLLITNFSNLILLPALLVTFEHGKGGDMDTNALIRHYDESYHEEDDDIDLNLKEMHKAADYAGDYTI